MTEKEFRSHFDAIRCSDAFCQKMEILLSEKTVPAAFADTAEGVIQMKRRNVRNTVLVAACLLLVIGGAAGVTLYGRLHPQPIHPTPIETTDTEPSETTETFVYPILTETIPVNTTHGTADSTQLVTVPVSESTTVYTETMAETQTASRTQEHTMLTTTSATTTASPTETTTTTRMETTTSTSATTTASPTALTTTSMTTTTTSGTTTSYEWGWWYSTTYSETTTTMYHDWAVSLEYSREPMAVGETREVEYYHPGYRGEPLEITIVSCTNNVIYEIDSVNNMIYVTALEPGNVSICVRGRGAMFDSYIRLTVEDNEQIYADYGTALEYDESPMKVGETRGIRYYHPAKPNSIVGCWSMDESSDNISCQLDETRGVVYVTALAPGDAKVYIAADGCSFGQYAYLTIEE